MASVSIFSVSLHGVNLEDRPRFGVRAQGLGGKELKMVSSDQVVVNETTPLVEEREKSASMSDGGNGRLKSSVEKKMVKDLVSEHMKVLWDDGYGTNTVKDFLNVSSKMIKPDGGPPRWFCPVECGRPVKDSPVLLFLPGLDGVGMGLLLHHKALGKVFEVRCLHIPIYDRTPFEELVAFVEETVRLENALCPNKPIYLVGDSFGGCLALAVAARNPKIDLVVILVNPATSYGRSQLQPLIPFLEALPDGLHNTVPYLLSLVIGDPVKLATVGIGSRLPSRLRIEQLSRNVTALLPLISGIADIVPRETLAWKLKLIKSAAAYANARLHAVRAEVLLLVSDKDNMLPSRDEAKRLKGLLHNCTVRHFKDNGHILLLEDGISLLTIIKGTSKYRRSRRHDFVSDFVPPSISEYRYASDQVIGFLRFATSAVMFSTMEDGKIVKGLAGVPSEGPVLFVGYHMLMGLEIYSFIEEFLREKNIMVHGVAHPMVFFGMGDGPSPEFSLADWMKIMGAVPVSASHLFKLLSAKSHVLLYPGGAREALHYKGEQYKLFWPNRPEFVRMAARFGATIVPFGTVGEDDIADLVLDYNDWMKIPVVNDYIRERMRKVEKIRDESLGEVANQQLFTPGMLPKIPGRFYYLFGKPIKLKGKEDLLKDKETANQLYLHVQSEIGANISYLLKKREEDPYRNIVDRIMYRAFNDPSHQVPAFDP
ncbi:hypothetical protein SLE2022_129340 [Rubroshorea leprosula]